MWVQVRFVGHGGEEIVVKMLPLKCSVFPSFFALFCVLCFGVMNDNVGMWFLWRGEMWIDYGYLIGNLGKGKS